ncbi:hypothetical protein C8A03DRAFT_19573, partial [Achaetomium macrosporum]
MASSPEEAAATPPDEETKKAWGRALATELDALPNVAFGISPGLDADPAPLIQLLKYGSDANRSALHAALRACNDYIAYLRAELEAKNNELTDSLRAQVELSKQFSESIKTAALPTKSAPRRQTSDPEKFSGSQKDPAERQKAYTNWRSQIGRNLVTD